MDETAALSPEVHAIGSAAVLGWSEVHGADIDAAIRRNELDWAFIYMSAFAAAIMGLNPECSDWSADDWIGLANHVTRESIRKGISEDAAGLLAMLRLTIFTVITRDNPEVSLALQDAWVTIVARELGFTTE